MLTLVSNINKIAAFILVITLASFSLNASDGHDQPAADTHEEEFDASKFILDHIGDSHEWHIITTRDGHHISVPLPIILLSKNSGLHFFMSGKLAHGHEYNGFRIMKEGEHAGSIVEINEEGEITGIPFDFSITKNVAGMLVAAFLLLFLFIKMGAVYKREGVKVPRGINSFLEPLVLFIRDKIALPNIGEKKYEKYTPFLLTTFFFILFNNLLGLIPFFPFGANVTGNIAVTLVLSMFTLIVTTISGSKDYWMHIFATPGVPKWLLPIMVPVEIIGMFTKPFALMIRLFANITAGHIIILSLISLIFIFKSLSVAPISIALVLFMEFLELLVAFLQAYVFTLLSALFIGLAVKEHHH
jgi:F-type H+-transporting ATPase subunit a